SHIISHGISLRGGSRVWSWREGFQRTERRKKWPAIDIELVEIRHHLAVVQPIRTIDNDRDHPVGVAQSFRLGVQRQAWNVVEPLAIPREDLTLLGDELVESFQLREPKRRLQPAHLVFVRHLVDFKIAEAVRRSTMITLERAPFVEISAIGHQHPALTCRYCLGTVKTERAGISKTSCLASSQICA